MKITARSLLITVAAVLALAGALFAFRAWVRSQEEPGEGRPGRVFATLEDPGIAKALFPPKAGVERKMEKVLPFRMGMRDFAVAVFATYELDERGHHVDFHAAAPMVGIGVFYHTNRGGWKCLDFRPEFTEHGTYGSMGEVSLAFLGPDRPALVLSGAFSGQGVTEGASSYHLLFTKDCRLDLKEMLLLNESFDDSGYSLEPQDATSVEARTEILPEARDGWYLVRITHQGSAPVRTGDRVTGRRTIHETATFQYDPAKGTYQLVPGAKLEGWWKVGEVH